MSSRSVLIIGAGGGLGVSLVEAFAAAGYKVFAADRAVPEKANRENAVWIEADITDAERYKQAIPPLTGIDVLIYAPGLIDFYPLSEAPAERTRKIIEVNALGLLTAVSSALPQLQKSKGRIITVSSESVGLMGAFQPYPASKTALEALHCTLRQEVQLLGIKMVLVRPGPIATPLLDQVKKIEAGIEENSRFVDAMKRFAATAIRYVGKVRPPEWYARHIVRIAARQHPRYIYRLNNNPLLYLLRRLPKRMMDRMVKRVLNKK